MADESLPYADQLITQAATLFGIHDDLSRVIGDMDIQVEQLCEEYDVDPRYGKEFEVEEVIRLFLFKKTARFDQETVAKKVQNQPYLQVRFGFSRGPCQQHISYFKRNKFPKEFLDFLDIVADGIREAAFDHGIRSKDLTEDDSSDPDEIQESEQPLYKYVDNHAPGVISKTVDTVCSSMDTGRAENTVHDDETVWEHQVMMSLMDRAGTQAAHRPFNKFRRNALHGDTHTRAVKKLATPPSVQAELTEFIGDSGPTPEWRRIDNTVQNQFNDAIDELLDILRPAETFTEPLVAAIDITSDPFHVSPWKGEQDIRPGDDRIVVDDETGKTKVPKEDYPEMVNGGEERGEYEYQYATLTVVGRNAPIILAIEPIRHNSTWEGSSGETVSYAEVVDRLLQQAKKHVDIHLVMADKAFDNPGVFHVLDQYHDVNYLIPKKENSDHLKQQVREVKSDETLDCRVEQGASLYLREKTPYIDLKSDPTVGKNGYSHDVTLMYVPTERDDWGIVRENGSEWAIFATNRENVTPMDALGFTDRYSDRWDIENSYKMVKPLLPSIASTDYRMRYFSFAFSCLLYNCWRLVDHELKVLATERFDDYGRGKHEDRLDTVIPLADFLATSIIEMFRAGLDPPDSVK